MTRRLPITATLTALVLCAAALRADLAVSPARLPGSSLDTSLRNETDRAVRQAARWLADRQRTDGAWGESNRVRHTSLALSALAAARQPEHSDAIARAALWLGATETNRLTCLGDHAWRLIALSLAVSETPERGRLFNRLAGQRAQETSDASEDDLRLWREALVQSRLSPPPLPVHDADAGGLLARAAAAWPPPLAGNRAAWRLARLINRAADGQLLHGHTPVDWRPHLAERLINSQKSDPLGGGFWAADTPDRQLDETAYGLLCLLEL